MDNKKINRRAEAKGQETAHLTVGEQDWATIKDPHLEDPTPLSIRRFLAQRSDAEIVAMLLGLTPQTPDSANALSLKPTFKQMGSGQKLRAAQFLKRAISIRKQ